MCGICGLINFSNRPVDTKLLGRMTDMLSHRGPDGRGVYTNKNFGLGHRRLKIIDLTEKAAQPMSTGNGDAVITYNGEIYNYKEIRQELVQRGHIFKSESDTEVVLAAYKEWGVDCLKKFIGMWAFCIWDRGDNAFFIARDRLGVKPLYYFYDTDTFIFASEIKSILESPGLKRRMNCQAIYEYLYIGYPLGDKTWFRDIMKIPPGCYLVVKNGKTVIKRYWDISPEVNCSINERYAKQRIKDLIESSVNLRLRSDVEVGAHLSGGIDSSLVVGTACNSIMNPIHTFSGFFKEAGCYDERHFIKEVLNRYPHIIHHEIAVDKENFTSTMKKIVWHMDEPVAGPGAYPQFYVSKLVHDNSIKVILGGQGGDELFGGYPYYYSGIPNSMTDLLRRDIGLFFACLGRSPYARSLLCYARREIANGIDIRRKFLNENLSKDFLRHVNFDYIRDNSGFYKGSVEEMMNWDIKNYLAALLQVEDRVSMAFSIETRLPLLDHRLVELAASIPFYLKINKNRYKFILREAVKDVLPLSVYNREDKKGFPTPYKLWISDKIFYETLKKTIDVDSDRVFKRKAALSWERLNVELWMEIFKAEN